MEVEWGEVKLCHKKLKTERGSYIKERVRIFFKGNLTYNFKWWSLVNDFRHSPFQLVQSLSHV